MRELSWRWLLAFVGLAIVVLASASGSPPIAAPVLRELDEEVVDDIAIDEAPPRNVDELRARVQQVLDREQVPGAAIALVDRNGIVWSGGVGVRDLQTRAPVERDTIFRVASITKSFIGLGVMRLVEQGKLDLRRPLAELLPDLPIDNAWSDVPVTLAHVLEHTAGFDDMRPNETFTADDAMTPAQALAINPRSRTVRWRPGSRFAYSNVGFGVAGRAIEIASGEPFDAWLRREVLQPLGMNDADFRRTPALAQRLAIGHRGPGEPAPFTPIAHRPAGALLASADDLGKLVHFWLRRGDGFPTIVSKAGLARIERSETVEWLPLANNYGLGNYGDLVHPVRMRGHDGGLPGFHSNLRYSDELGVGYVVLINATHSARAMIAIRRLVFAYLVQGRALPPLPEVPDVAPTPPAADTFAFVAPRHQLFGFIQRATTAWRLSVEGQRARIEALDGSVIELVPTKDGGLRHPAQSGTSIRIARDREGDEILVHHGAVGSASRWWIVRAQLWLLGFALAVIGVTPWLALVLLAVSLVRRKLALPLGLVVWPAIAALAFTLVPRCLGEAAAREQLGVACPWTVALCAATLLFAIASAAAMAAAVRWSVRDDRPSLWLRLPLVFSACACFGFTLWLGAHGIIGLRTWAW